MTIDVNSRPFQILHQLHQLCSNSTATSSNQQNPSAMLRWRFVDQVMIDTQSLGRCPNEQYENSRKFDGFQFATFKKLNIIQICLKLPA